MIENKNKEIKKGIKNYYFIKNVAEIFLFVMEIHLNWAIFSIFLTSYPEIKLFSSFPINLTYIPIPSFPASNFLCLH